MSSLLGGGSKTTTSSTPWAPQATQLQSAFTDAQNLYNQKSGTPWYTGELYAGMDPITQAAVNGTNTYATGAGATAANAAGSVGTQLSGASGNYLSSIGALGSAASADPTQANIASAGAYANNPYLNGQIDAIGTDISRNLNENTLPSIDRAATGTGNINSTRAGVAQGIAQRGAQEDLTNAAANIRSNAYQSGINTAEGARESNLGALNSAAGQYGNAVGQGLSGLGQGQTMNYQNLGQQSAAGQLNQANQQGIDNAGLQAWQGNDTRQQDLLQNYYNIIGANNWGGTSTSTQSSNPGILGGILGLASTGVGIASKLQGMGAF